MEHTPGPWTFVLIDPAPLPGFIYGIGHDPLGVSDIPWPTALAVTDADARLIAAAPEMLDALEDFDDAMAGNGDMVEVLDTVLLAIAAAKGEA